MTPEHRELHGAAPQTALGQTHWKGTAQRDPQCSPPGPAHLWVVQDNDLSVGGLQLLLPFTQGHSNHVSFLQRRTPTVRQLEVCPSVFSLLGRSPPSFQNLLSTLCKRGREISWRSSRVIPGSPAESAEELPALTAAASNLPINSEPVLVHQNREIIAQMGVFIRVCIYLTSASPQRKAWRFKVSWKDAPRAGEGEDTAVLTVTSISHRDAVPKPLWSSRPQARLWCQRPRVGFGTPGTRRG